MTELTELQRFSAVMYATLRKAGTHIANQPVIYVLTDGFGRFLESSGQGELVAEIDKRVDDSVLAACMVNPLDILEFLRTKPQSEAITEPEVQG